MTFHKNFFLTAAGLIVFLGLLSACSQPRPDINDIADMAYTQAAQTIVAQLTLTAPVVTDTPVPAPATATPPPSPTPLPTETFTPEPATATPTLAPDILDATATVDPALATQTGLAPLESGTALPTLAAVTGWETLFEDDFSNRLFWDVAEGANGSDWSMGYAQGAYRMFVGLQNDFIWSVRAESMTDVSLEVDARRQEGATDGLFGLVCRHVSSNNYYGLVVSADGSYGIFKKKGGKIEWLSESVASSPAIATGFDVTHLRADCIGSTLTLYAEGQKLAEAQDQDFPAGAAGLTTGTRRQPDFSALFDNFVLRAP